MNTFSGLIIHPRTLTKVELSLKRKPHAILLIGPAGSGKRSLAVKIGEKLLNLENNKDAENYQYFYKLQRPENKSEIPIEDVRALIKAQSLVVPGNQEVKSVAFIENADYLSVPAQNALLKTIEEPVSGTIFLLTAHSAVSLLPTIVSRTNIIEVEPISFSDAKKFWLPTKNETDISAAWQLSYGSAGLLASLLNSEDDHPLKVAINDAKKFIALNNKYERLICLTGVSSNKIDFSYFLDALMRVSTALHHAAVKNNRPNQANNLIEARRLISDAQSAITANVSSRLVSLQLVHSLKV